MQSNPKTTKRMEKLERMFFSALPFFLFGCMVFMNSLVPAMADNSYTSNISAIAKQIVEIVGYIFRIIGVIMAVYAIGTLIQAFQSNNPDAQARGAQVAIVAIILIFIPTIIKSFNLTQYLEKTS